jgi:hypothetical protein
MTYRLATQRTAIAAVVVTSLWTVGGDQPRRRVDPVQKNRPHVVAHTAGWLEGPQQYYVSPNGTPQSAGTLADPLDLATALAPGGPAGPGDTVWLRGGTYAGAFVSTLTGTPAAPIQVLAFPGERPTIDGRTDSAVATLTVNGGDTLYRDFEVTNTSPDRDRERGIGVNVFGPRVRIVNLMVHDTGNGIGLWSPAIEAELYGNIIYNVGWHEQQEGKGHSIYVQNETGVKRIVDNVLFNGYSFGIHAYTVQGRIDNLHIEGNVSFNHGLLSPNREPRANILVGGWHVAARPALIENFTYVDPAGYGPGAELGYWAGCSSARVLGNYLVGRPPIRLRRCEDVTMANNRFYGDVDDATVQEFPNNGYVRSPTGARADVFVRPNQYEEGRATIVVFNWSQRSSVPVDLTRARLRRHERFEIRDVQDYTGAPMSAGDYVPGTRVELSMTRDRSAQPVGTSAVPHTTAEFGVFVVQPAAPRQPRR